MSKVICYLAGPMTGLPGYNFPAFIHATEVLREAGYEVISPVELDWDVYEYGNPEFPSVEDVEAAGFDIHDTMRRDIEAILKVDQIVLLPGWQGSSGVQKELTVAGFIGIPVCTYHGYETPDGHSFYFQYIPPNSALASEPMWRHSDGSVRVDHMDAREGDYHGVPLVVPLYKSRVDVRRSTTEDAERLTARLAERHSEIQFNDSGMTREEYLDHMGKVADQQMPAPPWPHPTVAFADEGVNPKDLLGLKKPPLRLVPSAALIYMSRVMALGAEKYGPYNWRSKQIRRTVYLEAAMRHIVQALDGEDLDPESGMPHEAHAAACMGILLDALATGNLLDDRPTPGAASELIRELTLA